MSYSIIILPSFEKELFSISDYIALDNPLIAKRFVGEVLNSINENLTFMPTMFRIYEGNVRIMVYGNYLVFYEIIEKEKKVLLLHILHGARDLSKLNF